MSLRQDGFSLIELLLSVAIIGLLVGMSWPLYHSFQTRNDLDATTQGIADALRRAQLYARAGNGDSSWGVRVQSGSAVLFRGNSYASRTAAFDEQVGIASNITVGGLSDVVFAKFSAAPSATGNITLTANANDERTITLNAKGMVSY